MLLAKVITKQKKQKVPLSFAHDCWSTSIFFEKELKAVYYESFNELLLNLNNNPLIYFCCPNKIQFTQQEKDLFTKIENNRQILIQEIKTNYEISNFILSP